MPCCATRAWRAESKRRRVVLATRLSTAMRLRRGLIVLALGAPLPALALYKVVGPDGRVTYTDQVSTATGGGRVLPLAEPAAPMRGAATLPASLQRLVDRFPVTLYVAGGCNSACDAGRQLLRGRGVPFAERLVSSNADVEALERLSGGREAPTLSVGSQVVRGYTAALWTQYLDAAGYPAESRLPSSYQPPAPRPLVDRVDAAGVAPAAPAASAPAATPRRAETPSSAPRAGAAGIRF